MKEHTTIDRNYLSKNFYSKAQKLILKSNSGNTNSACRSVHASQKNRLSTWQKLFNTNLESGRSSRSQMYKTSKIKYLQIRNFLDYRVQNVRENSSKTSLLAGVSKQAKCSDRPWWKIRVFYILEGQFYKEKPSFVNLKKTKHSFEVFFPICMFSRCIFNLEMRNTGLVYHRHWAVSLLRIFV